MNLKNLILSERTRHKNPTSYVIAFYEMSRKGKFIKIETDY